MRWPKQFTAAMSLLLTLLLGACGTNPVPNQQAPDAWLSEAKLDAEETPEQLYAAAKDEGTLVVYSITSRMLDVKKSFEKAYPGLTVEVRDIRSNDLINLLRAEQQAGEFNCDLVVYADGDAILSKEFISEGLLHKYVPYDIEPHIYPRNNTDQLMFLGEVQQLIYNSEFSEEPPLQNWWELTEPHFYGRVYVPTPLRSSSVIGVFLTIEQQSEALAAAYESLYGKPLEVPNDSNAGKIFFERLAANGLVALNSGDEIAQSVSQHGKDGPAVGIIVSSKVRLRELGYQIKVAYGMEPFDGVYMPNSIMVAHGSKRINTAKLFIRWLLGEADGKGEGYRPYRTDGTWSCRMDIPDGSAIPLEEMNVLYYDKEYIYANRDDFISGWTKWSAATGVSTDG